MRQLSVQNVVNYSRLEENLSEAKAAMTANLTVTLDERRRFRCELRFLRLCADDRRRAAPTGNGNSNASAPEPERGRRAAKPPRTGRRRADTVPTERTLSSAGGGRARAVGGD